MMSREPSISLFMPVYNGEAFLQESIDSVLAQSFQDWELVCVDDESTDGSFAILQNFARQDGRIRVFRKNHGGNVPKSWNFAFPLFRGQWISYMSQDDFMSPDNLRINFETALRTGADIVVPQCVHYTGSPEDLVMPDLTKLPRILSGKEAFILSLDWRIHGFTLCRRELMLSEPFIEEYFNSDEYVTRKNFLRAEKVALSDGRFFFRWNNANSICKVQKLYRTEAIYTQLKLLELIENNLPDPYLLAQEEYNLFILMLSAIKRYPKAEIYERTEAARLYLRKHLFRGSSPPDSKAECSSPLIRRSPAIRFKSFLGKTLSCSRTALSLLVSLCSLLKK